MRKENVINNKGLSSRKSVVRDLPSAKSLLNKEQQPYCMKQAEGPGQRPAGTTTFFNNGGFPPAPISRMRPYGEYRDDETRSGFTLIELLVVVLIIGILSAVAVPQYQKAVGKVRYTQAKIYAHALADAQRAYYLANGTYSGDLEELDVQLPWKSVTNHPGSTLSSSWGDLGNGANCSITTAGEVNCRVRVAGTQLIYALILEHSSYTDSINTRTCATYSMNESSIQNQICKAETGLSTPTSTGVDAINWVYPD